MEELNEIQTASIITSVLAGQSWQTVADDWAVDRRTLRRTVANKLKLHIPKRRKRK